MKNNFFFLIFLFISFVSCKLSITFNNEYDPYTKREESITSEVRFYYDSESGENAPYYMVHIPIGESKQLDSYETQIKSRAAMQEGWAIESLDFICVPEPYSEKEAEVKALMLFDSDNNVIEYKVTSYPIYFKVNWIYCGEINYSVEHYQQNIEDDNYTLVTEDTVVLSGYQNQYTQAVVNNYYGFQAKTFEQEKLDYRENKIIRIYYDRIIYTVQFNTDGGTPVQPVSGKYGAPVPQPEEPEKDWWNFKYWSPAVPEYFTENITCKAIWEQPLPVSITVEFPQNQIAGELTLASSFNETENIITFTVKENVSYAEYKWVLDGYLFSTGSVCKIELMNLSAGTHTIMLTVKDSQNKTLVGGNNFNVIKNVVFN